MNQAQAQTTEPIDAGPGGEVRPAWWESALLLGLVLSLLLHLLLALAAALTSLRVVGRTDMSADTAMLLASLDEQPLTQLPAAVLPLADTAVRSTPREYEAAIEDLVSPVSAPAFGDIESLIGAGERGTEGLGLDAAGGGAQFFGVEARGSRFAFVVDVSGSMMEQNKIDSLRAALHTSVSRMLESAWFCIILFNTDATPIMGDRWVRVSEENRAQAQRTIASISAGGGTDPRPAFEVVFRLKPRPDAVYFMTDGIFTREVDEQLPMIIERYNRSEGGRVPVHCITFVDRGAEKTMRRIARQSGGTYTHVEAPRK